MKFKLIHWGLILTLIWLIGCSSAPQPCNLSSSTPTPEELHPGNGVFVREKITGRVGVVIGTECYVKDKFVNDCLFTVKFTDYTWVKAYGTELTVCGVQNLSCSN